MENEAEPWHSEFVGRQREKAGWEVLIHQTLMEGLLSTSFCKKKKTHLAPLTVCPRASPSVMSQCPAVLGVS